MIDLFEVNPEGIKIATKIAIFLTVIVTIITVVTRSATFLLPAYLALVLLIIYFLQGIAHFGLDAFKFIPSDVYPFFVVIVVLVIVSILSKKE